MTSEQQQAVCELIQAASNLSQYRDHLSSCEIEQTDFCTCGMQEYSLAFGRAVLKAKQVLGLGD